MPVVGITAREAKRQKQSLRRERERELKKLDREKLRALRERVKSSRQWRAGRVSEIVKLCQRARAINRERAKEIRAAWRRAAKEEIEALRKKARADCEARKAKARRKGEDSIARAMRNLDQERELQRTMRIYDNKKPLKGAGKTRTTAAERRAESDDTVRNNLPGELVPVFNKVRSQIKETARKTRTEAFLDWAHNHGAQVQKIMDEAIEADVARLVREEKKLRAYTMKPQAYTRMSDAELLKRYSAYQGAPEVPF